MGTPQGLPLIAGPTYDDNFGIGVLKWALSCGRRMSGYPRSWLRLYPTPSRIAASILRTSSNLFSACGDKYPRAFVTRFRPDSRKSLIYQGGSI